MVYLGLENELLTMPSIWLCVGCRRCSDCCSQQVEGRRIIRALQELAISSGAVDPWFPDRLEKAHRILYNRFIAEIDALLNDGKCLSSEGTNETREHQTQTVFSP